jgi:cysteine-rich repeat protein
MHTSNRLAKTVCFGLILLSCSSSCSRGTRPLHANGAPDVAVTAGVQDASAAQVVDARSSSEAVLDGPSALSGAWPALCGNGKVDRGEQCDDGNTLSGDGCSRCCLLEDPSPQCGLGPGQPVSCYSINLCGNGILTRSEECDDGNTTSGDGCSAACRLEPGWRCRVPGKRCLPLCSNGTCGEGVSFDAGIDLGAGQAVCGDGVVSDFEECDCGDGTVPVPDGCQGPNADDTYGGCTTHCLWGPFCGDGLVNGPEECDLGRLNGDDCPGGCTLGCFKPHYCGDGIVDTSRAEQCDLGPLNGLVLDQDLNPTTEPDGMVYCTIDCSVPVPSFW